ncbi:MAG: formylglycine-generating enzyme family protein [Deltaproteobacteria bacterium]|nr:formylglycine-generating enzyme family protein [Deltaproteobacteria bacterium]
MAPRYSISLGFHSELKRYHGTEQVVMHQTRVIQVRSRGLTATVMVHAKAPSVAMGNGASTSTGRIPPAPRFASPSAFRLRTVRSTARTATKKTSFSAPCASVFYEQTMMRPVPFVLVVLLSAGASGCDGCGQSAAVEGGECEQVSDCAEGLMCLGRVCQQAPQARGPRDSSHDGDVLNIGADGDSDVETTDDGLDVGRDVHVDGAADIDGADAGDAGAEHTGQEVGVDADGDAGVDVDGGGTDTGIVVQCGPSPTGKGGEMCDVPAGPVWIGCNYTVDTECRSEEYPYHQVTVPAFKIDRNDVTAAEYEACVVESACIAADGSLDYVCNYGRRGREAHPINCVDWSQAEDCCTWAGKRLPTEAEWEMAARGTDGRKYPWGNDSLDCDHAVMSAGLCSNSGTSPVGSKPLGASPYGALDLIGNVWQWVADDWHADYTGAPTDGTAWVENPRGSYRVMRGGSWSNSSTFYLRVSYRNRIGPTRDENNFGFRCAYSASLDFDAGTDAQDSGPEDAGADAGADAGGPCATYLCMCDSYCKMDLGVPKCISGCRTDWDCCPNKWCVEGKCR